MKPYKSCSCRDPETGKLLGKNCPDLPKRHHGAWYARYEAPPVNGKRRQPRVGPFATEKECKAALAEVLGQVGKTGHVDDRKMTLGAYLDKRHEWRVSEAETGGGLKRSTLATDREIIDLYLKPGLGHVKLVDLRDHHIRDLYTAMRQINRDGEGKRPSEMLRRLLEARAVKHGARYSNRPVSESRVKRVHIVLNAALNDAVTVSKLLLVNPAAGVFRGKGGAARKGKAKPLLWTDERVAHWEKTGNVPARVMVWTAAQCGAFLDFAEADRLYPLWHLDAYWGMRRGELVGLDWRGVSLERRRLHVLQAQPDDELDDVKSEDSARIVVFDEATADVLKAWRKRQMKERVQWGEAWTDTGRVFTREDGQALRPESVSQHFVRLIRRYGSIRRHHADGWTREQIVKRARVSEHEVEVALAGPPLPPVRLHDLRHGSATMLLAAGVDMKVVSEILGHASAAFTSDVYAVVAEELAEDAAARIAAFVPRRNRA
ncbi:tyrosine-type recombinase/integrase [Actinomadura sp. LD22]|uniref:Tyrosine-type recombinase/integrase n=1 Tax=Actinomadura physcomitrii TaxID=2650748 RepID=A0A6I4MMG0_9ACTN|nr:site-specific integrase [Actinomadura physcomitrii]MWA05825.1 tyrosine-type recombinase/integrase [Actinomadura physcomitrii]